MLIELFSLGVTAEALRANIDGKSAFLVQRGEFDPKFQVKGVAPTNHSSCQKTRMNDLSCSIKMWAQVSFVFVTNYAFGRRTDRRTTGRTNGRTAFSWLYRALHYMQSHGNKIPPVC